MTTRKGSGPPAPRGNRRTLKHGLQATEKTLKPEVEAKTQEILASIEASAPVRASDGGLPPEDRHMARLAAFELVRAERAAEWLSERDMFEGDGKVLDAVSLAIKCTSKAAELLDKLGMSPTSRAKLGLDLARTADLATAMSEPNAKRRRKMLRDIGVVDVDAEDVD